MVQAFLKRINNILSRKYSIVVTLALIFVFFAIDRFYRITVIGMRGCDNFFYWETARQWLEGEAHLSEHYRPFLYWAYSAALFLFGENDYAIKILNATLDLTTLLFLYLFVYKVSRKQILAIASILLYGLLHSAVLYLARGESSHTLATTLTVSSLYFFYFYYQNPDAVISKASGLLALSGFLLGCTVNVRPEMALLGPAFVLLIVVSHVLHHQKKISKLVPPVSLFTAAFFIPIVFCVLYFGTDAIVRSFDSNLDTQLTTKANRASFLDSLLLIINHYFHRFSGDVTKWLFASALVTDLIFRIKGFRKPTLSLFLLPLTFHLVGYCLIISRSNLSRLFLPWLPLIMAYIAFWLYQVMDAVSLPKLSTPIRNTIFLGLIAALIISSRPKSATSVLLSATQKISPYREAYDQLDGKFSSQKKVLAAPLILYPLRFPLNHKMYFGDNLIYLLNLKPKGDLIETIKKSKISFLVIYKDKVLFEKAKSLRQFKKQVKQYFDNKLARYSPKKEMKLLEETAEKLSAKKRYDSDVLVIYEL